MTQGQSTAKNPPTMFKCCFNCRHSARLVALGLGFSCVHPDRKAGAAAQVLAIGPGIPHPRYLCPLFECKPSAAAASE